MPIKATRALLAAALDGSLNDGRLPHRPEFRLRGAGRGRRASTPPILDPRSTWADKAAYDRQARRLVGMFVDNFEKFESHVDAAVLGAAPRMQEAAE